MVALQMGASLTYFFQHKPDHAALWFLYALANLVLIGMANGK